MGTWLTRTRTWVYIAFYDEYAGRHINTCVGLSLLFMVPLYLYGLKVNRNSEESAARFLYGY
jgi:hypothetical protein